MTWEPNRGRCCNPFVQAILMGPKWIGQDHMSALPFSYTVWQENAIAKGVRPQTKKEKQERTFQASMKSTR